MANNKIQLKRSLTSGNAPLAAQLSQGELAINLPDRRVFTKDGSNAVIDVFGQSLNTTAVVAFSNGTFNNIVANTSLGASTLTSNNLTVSVNANATTLNAGNTTISGWANLTSTLQVGGLLTASANLTVTSGGTQALLTVGSSSQTQWADIIIKTDTGGSEIFRGGSGYSTFSGTAGLNIYNSNVASGHVAVYPGSNTTVAAVFAAANGNVGIGNNTPASKLHVTGNTSLNGDLTVAGSTYYKFEKPTPSTYQTVARFGTDAGGVFVITDNAIVSSGLYYNAGWIATATSGGYIDLSGGGFSFSGFTGATVGAVPPTVARFSIAANGNIGIANATPTHKLSVNGTAYFGSSVNVATTFAAGNTTINGFANVVGDMTVSGNLTVSGTATYINTTTLNIGDSILTLNADLTTGTSPTENAGLEVNRGNAANVSILWNETSDKWDIGNTNIVGTANVSGGLTVAGAINRNPNILVTLTSDVTGTANTTLTDLANGSMSITTTLSNTGVVAGTYGNTSVVPVITVDSKGRLTSATISATLTGDRIDQNPTWYAANNTLYIHTAANNWYTTIAEGNTTTRGVLYVIDSISNTSTTVAASANTVKTVYDLAVSANTRAYNAQTAATSAYSNAVSYADGKFAPLTGASFTGAVYVYGGDSATIFKTKNTSASSAEQLYITHNLGSVNIGNYRGNINFPTNVVMSDVTVSGNLTVTGTTTYINTTQLNVGDNIIVLNADVGAVAPTEDAGFTVNRGSGANVSFLWDETNDYWTYGNTYISGNLTIANGGVFALPNTSIVSTYANDPADSTNKVFAFRAFPTISYDPTALTNGDSVTATILSSVYKPSANLTTGTIYGYGVMGLVSTDSTSVGGFQNQDLRGMYGNVFHYHNSNLVRMVGVAGRTYNRGTGTVAAAYSIWARNNTNTGGGVLTDSHGLYVDDIISGTNNYGITTNVSAGTNKWNIYAAGTANNYFAGNIGIGSTTPAGALTIRKPGIDLGANSAWPEGHISIHNVGAYNGNTGPTITFYKERDASNNEGLVGIISGQGTYPNQRLDFIMPAGAQYADYLNPALSINANTKFVGVGSTSPKTKLDVVSGSNTFAASFGSNITLGSWTGLHFGYNEITNALYRKSALVFERQDSAARGKIHILNNGANDSTSAGLTDAKLTIQYDGAVGVGTTSPSRKLHVVTDTWDNTTGAAAIIECSNTVGAGITLKPSASVVSNGSNGWAIYAGGPGAAVGDGNLGFWAHGTNSIPFVVLRNGNVGIGAQVPATKLQIEEAGFDTTTTAITTTTQTAVHSYTANAFRSAEMLVQIVDSTNSQYHTAKILLIHNGTTVNLVQYGVVHTAAELGTFDADISGGLVRLLFTAAAATTKSVKVLATMLTV